MSGEHHANDGGAERPGSASPGWRVVFARELTDLWSGGKAPALLTIFASMMGITSYLLATNNELNLTPIKEIAYLMLQLTIAFGLFVGLIIGADSISGERERGTLEGLLLTPTSRRQIVVGKFLAALTPWPAALAISFAFVAVLVRDGQVVGNALLWGSIVGTVMLLIFTGMGMLVSSCCNSNRTSIFVSLVLCLVFLLPTQFPGSAQTGAFADWLQKWNPLQATNVFLAKVIVNNRTVGEMAYLFSSPILFVVLVLGLLFLYVGPGLRLEAGRARPRLGRAASAAVIAWLLVALGLALTPARAAAGQTGAEPPLVEPPLQISTDEDWTQAKVSDEIEFATVVTNNGTAESPPMIVAMNIIDLEGEVVDPEDWSPKRTEYTEPLAPGQSIKQTWTINAILKGNYMVYMVVIPVPDRTELTSQPVASSGLHLTVTPYTRLNPGGILPFAVGIPLGLTMSTGLLRWRRRRAIKAGEA